MDIIGRTNQKRLAVLFWLLSAVCMGVIFWLSSRTGDESSAQSDTFVGFLAFLIKDTETRIVVVRKTAHCMEYAGLGLLLSGAWAFTKGSPKPLWAVLCTALYAATDEVHQLFVEERSCELPDVGIDTLGGILGAVAFAVLLHLVINIASRNRAKRTDYERTGI